MSTTPEYEAVLQLLNQISGELPVFQYTPELLSQCYLPNGRHLLYCGACRNTKGQVVAIKFSQDPQLFSDRILNNHIDPEQLLPAVLCSKLGNTELIELLARPERQTHADSQILVFTETDKSCQYLLDQEELSRV